MKFFRELTEYEKDRCVVATYYIEAHHQVGAPHTPHLPSTRKGIRIGMLPSQHGMHASVKMVLRGGLAFTRTLSHRRR